jgi:hypothetical protein
MTRTIERSRRRSLAHVFLGVSSRGAAADPAMAPVPVEADRVNVVISRCSELEFIHYIPTGVRLPITDVITLTVMAVCRKLGS